MVGGQHFDSLHSQFSSPSLVDMIRDSSKKTSSNSQGSENEALAVGLPLSPASEAFAEILLCEIALKNRDRFTIVWNILSAHYNSRLTYRPSRGGEGADKEHQSEAIKLTPGIEKCVTGILRLCVWTSNRNMIANQVLPTLNILHPPLGALIWSPLELNLDKHLAEGMYYKFLRMIIRDTFPSPTTLTKPLTNHAK